MGRMKSAEVSWVILVRDPWAGRPRGSVWRECGRLRVGSGLLWTGASEMGRLRPASSLPPVGFFLPFGRIPFERSYRAGAPQASAISASRVRVDPGPRVPILVP